MAGCQCIYLPVAYKNAGNSVLPQQNMWIWITKVGREEGRFVHLEWRINQNLIASVPPLMPSGVKNSPPSALSQEFWDRETCSQNQKLLNIEGWWKRCDLPQRSLIGKVVLCAVKTIVSYYQSITCGCGVIPGSAIAAEWAQNDTSAQQTLDTSTESLSSTKCLPSLPTLNDLLSLVNALPVSVSVNCMDFSLPGWRLGLFTAVDVKSRRQENSVSHVLMELEQAS